MEEEEHVQFEEEEYTTIYRKTKRTQSRKTKSKDKHKTDDDKNLVKTQIQLNPFLTGAKARHAVHVPDSPRDFRKSDFVQQMVKDTLNEYTGSDVSNINQSNRLFLAECDFDDDDDEEDASKDVDNDDFKQVESQTTVWRFKKTGRKGLDRFRRTVEFVIIARQLFTCRHSVPLSRRDKILFFMDTDTKTDSTSHEGTESELKFDLNAFKSLGQKTNTAAMKSCLDIPSWERTDSQINKLKYMLRSFSRFSSYPAAVQSELCKKGWYAKFQSSQVLVKEGNRAEFYYLVLSGVAVYRDIETVADELNTTTNQAVTSYLKAGDTLGEKEILTNSDRAATVVCREPVEVLGLDRETFLDIFNAAGGLGSIDYLRKIPELRDFPLELLQTYHFSMAVHYYRRGAVIVKNSNDSEWIYVVKSGSCQIYQALKDGVKPNKLINPKVTSKSKLSAGNGSLLPAIHRAKNENNLKSASTDDLSDSMGKKKKKQHPGLERSITLLPVINPGRASMVHTQTQDQKRVETPTVHKLRRQNSRDCFSPKHRLKHSKNSPKSTRRSFQSGTPDHPLLTRQKTALCDTPDSLKTPRLGQSPYPESIIETQSIKVSSPSSDSDDWRKDTKRDSVASDPEVHFQSRLQENQSADLSSLFYVRLGVVNENGVFGMHPLIYENTPSLSLISNGAECVLVSKQFLKDQMDSTIAHRLKNNLVCPQETILSISIITSQQVIVVRLQTNKEIASRTDLGLVGIEKGAT